MKFAAILCFLISPLVMVVCFETHSGLNSIVFTNVAPGDEDIHHEYYYGQCATLGKTLAVHQHLEYEDIQGKLLVRGFLNTTRAIDCVYVRSRSPVSEVVKYKGTKFTMCLTTYLVIHARRKYHYYTYEWFIPAAMKIGLSWDLFFYYYK